jgi:CRISPR-associated endonuclease/helicase Cas3
VTVFSAPDYPPPSEIRSLVGDAERALRGYDGDAQSLEAMRRYFGEVYWRMDETLDGREKKKAILPRLDLTHEGTNFAFRSIAEDFRMIESNMVPVIVRWDDKARQAVDKLAVKEIPSGKIARKLQTYVVQVPPKARELLVRCGHVAFECATLRSDQFAVLQKQSLYDPEIGLLWETPEYLALEDMFM